MPESDTGPKNAAELSAELIAGAKAQKDPKRILDNWLFTLAEGQDISLDFYIKLRERVLEGLKGSTDLELKRLVEELKIQATYILEENVRLQQENEDLINQSTIQKWAANAFGILSIIGILLSTVANRDLQEENAGLVEELNQAGQDLKISLEQMEGYESKIRILQTELGQPLVYKPYDPNDPKPEDEEE